MDNIKPFVCDVCGKPCKLKGNLDKHKLIHNTRDKPYQCEYCKNTFCSISALARHKNVHTGVKPFKCDVCEKTFMQKNNLTRHKKIHTGVKPYTCDICKKTFSNKMV